MRRKWGDKRHCGDKAVKLRILFIGAMFFVVFCILVGRAVFLSVVGDSKVERLAKIQYHPSNKPAHRRGRILDDKGRELAISIPVYSVFANPRRVEEVGKVSRLLSKILSMPMSKVKKKLEQDRGFVWIKRRISEKEAEQMKQLHIEGVELLKESKRFYPNDKLAANVLGAVGFDSQALGGVELAYDKYLMSQRASGVYERDARGRLYYVPVGFSEQFDIGDVYLTIDKTIQFIAEQELEQAVSKWEANGGVIVVLEPYTGAILAMANIPTFDPNLYSEYNFGNWRNRAVTDVFEPGSTFKVILAASALEHGVVSRDMKFFCENGVYEVGKVKIHDVHPYGELSFAEILWYSSNVGVYKIAQLLGKSQFYSTLVGFGFGKKSGIDFPGEAPGIVSSPTKWSQVHYSNIAFGQGIGVTPLQLINAFAAIANGGMLMKPHIVKRVVNYRGSIVYEAQHTILSNPISIGTAQVLVETLEGVVKNGTGKLAYTSQYRLAGKTGTAQKINPTTRRYSDSRHWASFVGFGPVEEPRIVVLVVIDEPKGAYYGGVVAAPVFRNVAVRTLQYLSVPHSKPLTRVVRKTKVPQSRSRLPVTRYVPVFIPKGSNAYIVPPLRGLTMRQVLQAVGKADVRIKLLGSGVAVRQSVKEGGVIKKGQTLLVRFSDEWL